MSYFPYMNHYGTTQSILPRVKFIVPITKPFLRRSGKKRGHWISCHQTLTPALHLNQLIDILKRDDSSSGWSICCCHCWGSEHSSSIIAVDRMWIKVLCAIETLIWGAVGSQGLVTAVGRSHNSTDWPKLRHKYEATVSPHPRGKLYYSNKNSLFPWRCGRVRQLTCQLTEKGEVSCVMENYEQCSLLKTN